MLVLKGYFRRVSKITFKQNGPRTEPEPETGTVGTVLLETEVGTGTVGTVFQEPKPGPEQSLSCPAATRISMSSAGTAPCASGALAGLGLPTLLGGMLELSEGPLPSLCFSIFNWGHFIAGLGFKNALCEPLLGFSNGAS